MGKRCRYEESFLSEEQVIRLCRQQAKCLTNAGQVVILQRLMQERKWRQADLAAHSDLKRGQISKVLKVRCFPENSFWWRAANCLGLKISRLCEKVEEWMDSENPRS